MGNYNLRDNYVIEKEFIIQKQSSDLFFGNYTIFIKNNQNQYLLRIDTYANSKEKLEEIVFSIDKQKNKSPSNIIYAKDIANNNKITCTQGYNISLYYNYFKTTLIDEIKIKRKNYQSFSENQIWFILNEISRAIAIMKDKQIAHWNVKPQHIFKDENENYFLYDSSYFIDHRNPTHFIEKKINHKCCYISPQLYENIKESTLVEYEIGFQNDIYNLGQIILLLMTLKDPILTYYKNGKIDQNEAFNQVRRCNGIYSLNLTFLVMKMLQSVHERLKIEQLRKLLKPIEDKIVRNLDFYKSYKIWEYLEEQRGSSYRSSMKSSHKQLIQPNINLKQLKKVQIETNQLSRRSNKISLGKSNSIFYSPRSKNNNYATLEKLMKRESNQGQINNTVTKFPQYNEIYQQSISAYESDNKMYMKLKKNQ